MQPRGSTLYIAAEEPAIRTMLAISTAIIVAAALYFARSIFAPFAFALFIMAIVWPVQSTLQNRLPQFVALFLTLIATVLVIVAFGTMVAWAVSVVAEWMISHAPRFQEIYLEWAHWLEEHDILIVGRFSEHFDAIWMVRMLQTVAGHVNKTVGFALLAFVFMMLALLETGDLQQKLASLGERREFRELSQAGAEIATKFRKYMLVRTLVSALTGVAVWAFALIAGLELAVAWGIIAFALNYIPFIGPFVATILPGLFALAQFDSWQSVAIVFVGLTMIQFLIGNAPNNRGCTCHLASRRDFRCVLLELSLGHSWGRDRRADYYRHPHALRAFGFHTVDSDAAVRHAIAAGPGRQMGNLR